MRNAAKVVIIPPMKIALYDNEKSVDAQVKDVTWEELIELLRVPRVADTKYGPAWSPVELHVPIRRNEHVKTITACVLDLDGLTNEEVEDVARRLEGLRYIVHSSFSDEQAIKHLRAVIALRHPIMAENWRAALPGIIKTLGVPADPACKDLSRIFFLPARPAGADYFFATGEGEPLDVDEIIKEISLLPKGPSLLGDGLLGPQAKPADLHALREATAWLEGHGPAIEGQNGDLHTYIAAAALTHDFALSTEEAWPLLRAWNQGNRPPWKEAELLTKAQNASTYATEPYGSKRPHSEELIAFGRPLGEFVGECEPEKGQTWLIPGIVAAGVPQIIAGPPKAMKSYMALHMSLALAAGKSWLHGDFTPNRQYKVLIIPKEDSVGETKRRLWWLSRGMGVAPNDLNDYLYVDAETNFRFDNKDDIRRMQSTIEQLRPDLIVVDSLTEAHQQDENSAVGLKVVIDNWSGLCRSNGVAIACIHHFRKPGEYSHGTSTAGVRLRGSSALHARVRHIVGVEPKERAVSGIRVEGNLPGLPDNFLVRMQESVDTGGKPCYRLTFQGWQ